MTDGRASILTSLQALAYGYHHGRMYNPLLAVSVQLSDAAEGDGGYVVIRGSHKARHPFFAFLPSPARLAAQASALPPQLPSAARMLQQPTECPA